MRVSAHSALRIIYYHSARVLRNLRLTVAARPWRSYASVSIVFSRDIPPRLVHAARATRTVQDITHCYIPNQAADQEPTKQWKKPRPLQSIIPIQLFLRACHAWLLEHVFLSTAIVQVADGRSRMHECRPLLDQGSQVNILKKGFAKRVGLKWESM